MKFCDCHESWQFLKYENVLLWNVNVVLALHFDKALMIKVPNWKDLKKYVS